MSDKVTASVMICVIADFKVNVMSLDDLMPASPGFTEETPGKQVGNDRTELRTVLKIHHKILLVLSH